MSGSPIRGLRTQGALSLWGAGLILASGLIHLLLTPEHFEEAAYLGLLFIANFAGSVVAALGIIRGQRWGWIMGALVAGGACVAYLIDGTVGLPGMEAGDLLEPVGVLTKTLEALFLVICAFELFTRFGRRALAVGIAAVLAGALFLLGTAPADHRGGGSHAGGLWRIENRKAPEATPAGRERPYDVPATGTGVARG